MRTQNVTTDRGQAVDIITEKEQKKRYHPQDIIARIEQLNQSIDKFENEKTKLQNIYNEHFGGG